MGLKLARFSGSKLGFLRSGVIAAILRGEGTWPDWSEWFIVFVMRGLMAERFDFIRIVGKGSRAQEDDFIFLMIPSISSCETSEKL